MLRNACHNSIAFREFRRFGLASFLRRAPEVACLMVPFRKEKSCHRFVLRLFSSDVPIMVAPHVCAAEGFSDTLSCFRTILCLANGTVPASYVSRTSKVFNQAKKPACSVRRISALVFYMSGIAGMLILRWSEVASRIECDWKKHISEFKTAGHLTYLYL